MQHKTTYCFYQISCSDVWQNSVLFSIVPNLHNQSWKQPACSPSVQPVVKPSSIYKIEGGLLYMLITESSKEEPRLTNGSERRTKRGMSSRKPTWFLVNCTYVTEQLLQESLCQSQKPSLELPGLPDPFIITFFKTGLRLWHHPLTSAVAVHVSDTSSPRHAQTHLHPSFQFGLFAFKCKKHT